MIIIVWLICLDLPVDKGSGISINLMVIYPQEFRPNDDLFYTQRVNIFG